MDLTSHGTGRLNRFNCVHLNPHITREKCTIGFPLGSNGQPGQEPPTYKPLWDSWIGEIVEVNGERVENPDWGTMWQPAIAPGMALTFGYAGSGKGNLLIPALLTYAGAMVVNDPKGELMWITGERRRVIGDQGGQKVANCDPFGEVQIGYGDKVGVKEPAMRYNPLAALNPATRDFVERCATIAEALAVDKDDRGSIFTGTGRNVIEGVVAAEATMNPGKASLREVRAWLNLSAPEFAAAVTAYLKEHPTGHGAAKLRSFTDMENRTNQSTLITARQQTTFLDNPTITDYFEPEPGEPTFSFDELTQGNLTVYIVLPGRLLGSYSGFSRLMFNQALEAVQRVRNENLVRPVTFLIDEAGTSLGRMDSVEQAYGLARGAGTVIWSFYQDYAQLRRDYPASAGTFVSNSACITVTGARDEETCKAISEYLGMKTIVVTSSGSSSSTSASGGSSGNSTNTSTTGVPVMFPDQIRGMDPSMLLCLMPSSQGNFLQSKLVYFRDPRFNGLYRPDPKYGPGRDAPAYPVFPYAKPPLSKPPDLSKSGIGAGVRFLIALGALLVIAFLGSGRNAVVSPLLGALIWFGLIGWAIAGLFPSKPKDYTGQWLIYRKTDEVNGSKFTIGSIAGFPDRH